jgi:hypothetical protein
MVSTAIVFATILWNPKIARAAVDYLPFEGEKTTWHDGFDRYDFVMDDATLAIKPFKAPEGEKFAVGTPAKGQRRCIVVVPKQAAGGNPWSWQGCYWDHQPQTEVELLRRGFHIAYITPDPGKQWDAWYTYVTEKHGLSKKPAFVGMSKGGVNEYDWTTSNPDKVSCIYADNPAIRPEAFMKLGELARNDVSLLNICGSFDFLLQRHTLPIEARYQQLGGRITVMIKDGTAHHPHSLRNPKPIADWIVQHMQPAAEGARPDFADEKFIKSYYYSLESTNLYLKEENTYANCRGPGFTECYDRYDAKTESQWGLAGLAVIVPNKVAPGETLGVPGGRDQSRCRHRPGSVGEGFSYRHPSAHRAVRAGPKGVGRRLQTHDRPWFFQEACDGRHRNGGWRSIRVGHRKPGQGGLHLRTEPRLAQSHVEDIAAGQSESARQGRRAAPARLRQARPLVQRTDAGR